MKKTTKIISISLAIIISILLIVISITCYIVFTPERLTPIMREQAEKHLTCETSLESVNLTFFSSFPNFALEISNLTLSERARPQEIVSIPRLVMKIDLMKYLFGNNVTINTIQLSDASANIVIDSLGVANYEKIYPTSDEEKDEDTSTDANTLFDMWQISSIDIINLQAKYIDKAGKIYAHIEELSAHIDGHYDGLDGDANISISTGQTLYQTSDTTDIYIALNNLGIKSNFKIRNNHIKGNCHTTLPSLTFAMQDDTLANRLNINIDAPIQWDNEAKLAQFDAAQFTINKLGFNINGKAQVCEDSSFAVDLSVNTKEWQLTDIIALVPATYSDLLNDFRKLDGTTTLNCEIAGTYNDSIMPIIDSRLKFDNLTILHSSLPDYELEQTTADINLSLDLNNEENTKATINSLFAKTGTNTIEGSGIASDLMDKILLDLKLQAKLHLSELQDLVPEDITLKMDGYSNIDLDIKTSLADIEKKYLNRTIANGTIHYSNIDLRYNDSIYVADKKGTINFSLPSTIKNKQFSPLLSINLDGTSLDFNMLGYLETKLENPNLNITATNPLEKMEKLSAAIYFDMDTLNYIADTICAKITKPIGYASFMPSKKDRSKPLFSVAYLSDSIHMNLGSSLVASTGKINIKAFSRYDKAAKNAFLQWNPDIDIDFNNGHLAIADFDSDINIPEIKFRFTPRQCNIANSSITIGKSDFALSGDITNIRGYIERNELLKGKLDFVSDYTNVNELMNLVNGLGSKTPEEVEVEIEAKTSETNPFIVPKGVDLTLNTNIKNAFFNNSSLENLDGQLTIKDGKVVLEQLGFTSNAAKMLLTGLYRSDRRNHLFTGFDFHLLDIDIEHLITMIPDIDSLVPMLSSFKGSGEFHLAAETYLYADYSPKMSTLRGAAAFEGKDLVILDNETFSTISRYLMFNKSTRNVVDSLAVEMTVFKNEIDIYPFHITMGKWQAVLAGRHNLDMSFDYHISLTKCPLPARLGLDIKGTFDDMKYKLVPCKYNTLYKPDGNKNEVHKRTLMLKKIISESLKRCHTAE